MTAPADPTCLCGHVHRTVKRCSSAACGCVGYRPSACPPARDGWPSCRRCGQVLRVGAGVDGYHRKCLPPKVDETPAVAAVRELCADGGWLYSRGGWHRVGVDGLRSKKLAAVDAAEAARRVPTAKVLGVGVTPAGWLVTVRCTCPAGRHLVAASGVRVRVGVGLRRTPCGPVWVPPVRVVGGSRRVRQRAS